jgi:hypothetical protein
VTTLRPIVRLLPTVALGTRVVVMGSALAFRVVLLFSVARSVVSLARRWIEKRLLGLTDAFEPLPRVRRITTVRMVLFDLLAIGLLDLLGGGIAINVEHVVVVASDGGVGVAHRLTSPR